MGIRMIPNTKWFRKRKCKVDLDAIKVKTCWINLSTAQERNANGCVKLVDFNSRVIQLGCSTDNCTDELGHYASEQVCRNMTDAPHFEKCCCNEDGCNGNQDDSKYKVVQEEPIPVNGLRCYQGQTRMDQPVNSTGGAQLLPCRQNANTCVKQVDFNHRLVQRGCTVAVRNCTDEQGQYSYTQVCKNMTDAPYQLCCCNGDGCNI
ncbi:hypothetical protein Ddc_24271 [Ditylenchus destructor]|nr:hypothetical protein Ddc_24271 [Ditylenchus destructor]